MDELVHHCIRELSFDGDLGCSVSRLNEFVAGFYTEQRQQTVDAAYCAFFWAVIVQQPNVHVGVVPEGDFAEVHIAPQEKAKRKAKRDGEDPEAGILPSALEIIEDARLRSLAELQELHGARLRIAVDRPTSVAAMTGMHILPSKVTPMVYTVLQLIARSRDQGMGTVELGKKTGYDQKTIFYLIKQLQTLDLVQKLRQGGTAWHVCVLNYFYERSALWKHVRDANEHAEDDDEEEDDDQSNVDMEGAPTTERHVNFEPIESRHLASLPLLRSRMVKLLKNCPNNTHAQQNILLKLGLAHPSTRDRRFFNTRLKDLVNEGIVELVQVPLSSKKPRKNAWIKCVRLVQADAKTDVSDPDPAENVEQMIVETETDGLGMKFNITVHRQMIGVLEKYGSGGVTISEISDCLGNLDKRMIEMLLSRMEEHPPPAHLSDLGVAQAMDHHGRERRYKFFTVAQYNAIAAREGFSENKYVEQMDAQRVGGWGAVDPKAFYETEEEVSKHVDNMREAQLASASGKEKKPRKTKNPILADGTVKKGRPRKDGSTSARPPAKKRAKKEEQPAELEGLGADGATVTAPAESASASAPAPKRRGRPPKKKAEVVASDGGETLGAQGSVTQPKPRARKRKKAETEPGAGGGEGESSAHKKRRLDGPEPSTSGVVAETNGPQPTPGRSLQESASIGLGSASPAQHSLTPLLLPPGLPSPLTRAAALPGEPTVDAAPSESRPMTDPLGALVSTGYMLLPGEAMDLDPLPVLGLDPLPPMSELFVMSPEQTTWALPEATVNGLSSPAIVTTAPKDEGLGLSSVSPSRQMDLLLAPTSSEALKTTPLASSSSAEIPPMAEPVVGDSGLCVQADQQSPPSSQPPQVTTLEVRGDSAIAGRQRYGRDRVQGNLSHQRRENEYLRVLDHLNGITTANAKEFQDTHQLVLEEMEKAGEAISGPVGVRADKRTVDSTLTKMCEAGKIKILKTIVRTPTGLNRSVSIAYLPSVPQEKITAFISELGRNYYPPAPSQLKKVEEVMDFGRARHPNSKRTAIPLQLLQMDMPGDADELHWAKNAERANQLFSYDDVTVRNVMLSEHSTLAQAYGYMLPRMTRARELHISTIHELQVGAPGAHVVSQGERILDLGYYFHEFSLAGYCAAVSISENNEQLANIIETEQGRTMTVGELPPDLHATLQIGRARSKTKILELLILLRALNLVVPLVESKAEQPWLTCVTAAGTPAAFDRAPLTGWSPDTIVTAPTIWKFNTVAPLHLWSVSKSAPPFVRDVPVLTPHDCIIYWEELKTLALDTAAKDSQDLRPTSASATGPLVEIEAAGRSVPRKSAWKAGYCFTWHQERYMARFIDKTGATPLADEDGGNARIQNIGWVISAPLQAVREFYAKAQSKVDRVAKRRRREKREQHVLTTKAELSRKAKEARAQREQAWEGMVATFQPELRRGWKTRLKPLRARYMSAPRLGDEASWMAEIKQALLQGAQVPLLRIGPPGPTFMIYGPDQPQVVETVDPATLPAGGPPVVQNPPEPDIQTLIEQQGPTLPVEAHLPKKKANAEGSEQPKTRRRFHWTAALDSLARDAGAIIRARCRQVARLQWGALDQVFPGVARGSVRQRIGALAEEPNEAVYAKRLEDMWFELWVRYRGTEWLPDENPRDVLKFDLRKHVEFLRRHLDKRAARMGLGESQAGTAAPLPRTVTELERTWNVKQTAPGGPTWDFMWEGAVEGGREKMMREIASAADDEELPAVSQPDELVSVAESAIKLVFGTPAVSYEADKASAALRSVGEAPVTQATLNLLDRGVVSKLVKDPKKPRPGRMLKISETNLTALEGSIAADIFQDAAAFEDFCADAEGSGLQEWPFAAADGDIAALCELVSDDKISFDVDISVPRAARERLDWNSKRADDDELETTIRFDIKGMNNYEKTPTPSPLLPRRPELASETDEPMTAHGLTAEEDPACCSQQPTGAPAVVDCQACLDKQLGAFLTTASPELALLVAHIQEMVFRADSAGIRKRQLLSALPSYDPGVVIGVVERLATLPCALVFWAGYRELVLVSSRFARRWTVAINGGLDGSEPVERVFPRRWLALDGKLSVEGWTAAMRAVVAVVAQRPGVSQTELGWRLREVYDRRRYMRYWFSWSRRGLLRKRCESFVEGAPPDEEEEKRTCWVLGDRHWFQL